MTGELAARWREVLDRVAAAATGAGRDPAAVRVIAVSKLHPAAAVEEAYRAGVREVGENYAQELVAKMAALGPHPDLAWHFIGRLQRNKARLVVGRAVLIHAVDSVSLGVEIGRRAQAAGLTQRVLVEVNLAGEASKGGVTPAEVAPLCDELAGQAGLVCAGLMTMPPLADDPEASRGHFRALRALRDRLATPARPLPELSMGTTGDFEVAVAEGATLVRIGTAIFGPRPAR